MDLEAWDKGESREFTVPENTHCASEGLGGEATPMPNFSLTYPSLIAESHPQVSLALNSMTLWDNSVIPLHSPLGAQLWGLFPSSHQRTVLLD